MKVLVTGGAGMVGSHSAEYYAKKGEDVVVLDNLMRSKLFGYDKKSVEYNWNYLKKYLVCSPDFFFYIIPKSYFIRQCE